MYILVDSYITVCSVMFYVFAVHIYSFCRSCINLLVHSLEFM